MRKRWFWTVHITLASVMIMAFAMGCASSPGAPASTVSQFPADISGNVLVVDKVIATYPNSTKKKEQGPRETDRVFWIIDVSVKNNNYNYPMNSMPDQSVPVPKGVGLNVIWSVIIDGKIWSGPELDLFAPSPMSVSKGQSGKTAFLFESRNINPSDAAIGYSGEEPFSYGKLRGIGKVAAYDWNLKKEVKIAATPSNEPNRVESYLVMTIMNPNRVMNLKTVQNWSGDSSKDIGFRATKIPWVINAGYTPTSSISTRFNVTVWKGNLGTLTFEKDYGPFKGVSSAIIEETGDFRIKVESSGCKWWAKVGVE